jgi:methyltransferase family protein
MMSVCSRVGKMLVLKFLHQSDYQRWTTSGSLETWWDTRTEKIAQLIPHNTRVIEFGAGRRQLEKFLDRSCSYIPSDLTDRGPGTIICDLNRPLPDLRYVQADVAVFSGVLEYVRDLEALIKWLSVQIPFCIASYTYVAPNQNVMQRIRDRFDRLYYGYMHNYTEEELVHLFNRWGFVCTTKDTWTSQRIFLFANQRTRSLFHGPHNTFSLSPANSRDLKA